MSFFTKGLCCGSSKDAEDDDDDNDGFGLQKATDHQSNKLSYVGTAAYERLRRKHRLQHHTLWNVTTGGIVGSVLQSPPHLSRSTTTAPNNQDTTTTTSVDPEPEHSDFLPEKIGEILSRTEIWADLMSLGPPDGLFMEAIQQAIQTIAVRANENNTVVTIRMMFGMVIGLPIHCSGVRKKVTALVPVDCEDNICLWVGAWRKGVSWNHAKIIAVDGIYLHTGGHNLWDYHYLKTNPVYDLSIELKGSIAHDGHIFANDQWDFLTKIDSTCLGSILDKFPDDFPLVATTRFGVSAFPKGKAAPFPPQYKRSLVRAKKASFRATGCDVPMISVGRYGSLLRYYRTADDAFLAMFDAAQHSIRMALQDLGPVCVPSTHIPLPGCVWPQQYLVAFARAIIRNVPVEIILSNPGSVPGELSIFDANYGNGWSCVDVAAEIMKRVQPLMPRGTTEEVLRQKITSNLRICFVRRGQQWDSKYSSGMNIGFHSKHFIIDDRCCYIGSQNLYVCDLAEWGVIIDHEESVQKIKKDYWDPIWASSYTGTDLDLNEVIKGLKIDRDGETPLLAGRQQKWKHKKEAAIMASGMGTSTRRMKPDKDLYLASTE